MIECDECGAEMSEEVDPDDVRADFVESLDTRLWKWYDFNVAASWNGKTDQEKLIWREAFEAASKLIKSEEAEQYGN